MHRLFPFALALGLALCSAAPHARAEETFRRTISLSAVGTVQSRPDTAAILTGVVSEGPSAQQALEGNTKAMSAVIAALKEQGIAPKDIQTTDFSVHPRYEHPKEGAPAEIAGYRVVNSVRITVRDISKLGAILDKVVSLGSNEIGGIDFSVEDPSALEDEARKRAMKAALAKAKLLAEAAGAQVGPVLSIAEEFQIQPPRPMYARRAMAAKAADVPIEAGEHMVQVRVQVTWELN